MFIHVEQLKLSPEEKQTLTVEINELVEIYKTQDALSKEQIQLFYARWVRTADRLHKGSVMLDNLKVVTEEGEAHQEALEKLFIFLLRIVGLYDSFFKKMLKEEQLIRRSRNKVINTFYGTTAS